MTHIDDDVNNAIVQVERGANFVRRHTYFFLSANDNVAGEVLDPVASNELEGKILLAKVRK